MPVEDVKDNSVTGVQGGGGCNGATSGGQAVGVGVGVDYSQHKK